MNDQELAVLRRKLKRIQAKNQASAGSPTSIAKMSDHQAAVVQSTFEAQEPNVQVSILKRIAALDMRLDLKQEFAALNTAFQQLEKRSPGNYAQCLRHPELFDVHTHKDGTISIHKKVEAGGGAVAVQGGRAFFEKDGKWGWHAIETGRKGGK